MLAEVEKQFVEADPGTEETTTVWDHPLDLAGLLDVEPAPLQWFVKKRFIAGRGAVVSGIGGSSKTRLLFHLAAGAAIGRLPWDWEVTTTGRSLLVMTEDTAEDFHRTLHNLCLSLNLTADEKRKVYESIIPYPLAGKSVLLLQKTTNNTIEESGDFRDLVDKIRKLGDVVFVGLDPALSLTAGDELDQGHQRQLGKMADNLAVKTGATTLLVAHAPKNPKEEISSHNSRGGGALVDAVRTEFVMRTMTAKEAKAAKITDPEERFRHVQLVGTKGNYLPPGAYLAVWLRRDNYGMLHEADVEFFDSTTGPSKADLQALDVLKGLCETATPRLQEWRDALVETGLIKQGTQKAKNTAVHRIKTRLFDFGLIRSAGRGVWIPEEETDDLLDFND